MVHRPQVAPPAGAQAAGVALALRLFLGRAVPILRGGVTWVRYKLGQSFPGYDFADAVANHLESLEWSRIPFSPDAPDVREDWIHVWRELPGAKAGAKILTRYWRKNGELVELSMTRAPEANEESLDEVWAQLGHYDSEAVVGRFPKYLSGK